MEKGAWQGACSPWSLKEVGTTKATDHIVIRRLSIVSYVYWPIDILLHEQYRPFFFLLSLSVFFSLV